MKKKIGVLFVLLLTLICVPAYAKSKNNFQAGEDVVIDEKIGTTSFILGNLVDVQAEIDGISFVAGNNVSMSNQQDYAFIAGNNVNLNTFSAKDAFIVGNTVNIKGSTVRDLYAAGTMIKVEGVVSNNAYLAGETVVINANINGDVYISAENINIGENVMINGTLNYPENVKPEISKHAIVNQTKAYKSQAKTTRPVIKEILIDKVISYISMLVVAFVFLALYKKTFDKFVKYTTKGKDLLKTFGIGLLGLIVIPVISILLMITIIGANLGLLAIVIYGLLLVLSSIPTAYAIGKRIFKDKIENKYLLMALSLLGIYILELIPIIGGYVGFITVCIGLGIYIRMLKETIKVK